MSMRETFSTMWGMILSRLGLVRQRDYDSLREMWQDADDTADHYRSSDYAMLKKLTMCEQQLEVANTALALHVTRADGLLATLQWVLLNGYEARIDRGSIIVYFLSADGLGESYPFVPTQHLGNLKQVYGVGEVRQPDDRYQSDATECYTGVTNEPNEVVTAALLLAGTVQERAWEHPDLSAQAQAVEQLLLDCYWPETEEKKHGSK